MSNSCTGDSTNAPENLDRTKGASHWSTSKAKKHPLAKAPFRQARVIKIRLPYYDNDFRVDTRDGCYRSSKWHYRKRERNYIFDLIIMHFIADTDTDENYFEINFSWQIQMQLFFAVMRGGHLADKNSFENNFYFAADTDTEK